MSSTKPSRRILLILFVACVLALAAFMAFVAMQDLPVPTQPVEKELPRELFLPDSN